MRIITKIITSIMICFIIATIGYSYYVYTAEIQTDDKDDSIIEFTINPEKHIVTVSKTKNFGYNWEEITLSQGTAVLPLSGDVEVNDIITHCYGDIKLTLPSGDYLAEWNFPDKPEDEYEDIRFIGSWNGEGQEIKFNSNGTYKNTITTSKGGTASPQVDLFNYGVYTAEKTQIILNELYDPVEFDCSVAFHGDDSVLEIACPNLRYQWNLKRNFTNQTYLDIFNASNKLGNCLSYFIANCQNKTYKNVLSEGLNVTVNFTYNLTSNEISNFTNNGLVFKNDNNGNVTHYNTYYYVTIDSYHDLYLLISKAYVNMVTANDIKFYEYGCPKEGNT